MESYGTMALQTTGYIPYISHNKDIMEKWIRENSTTILARVFVRTISDHITIHASVYGPENLHGPNWIPTTLYNDKILYRIPYIPGPTRFQLQKQRASTSFPHSCSNTPPPKKKKRTLPYYQIRNISHVTIRLGIKFHPAVSSSTPDKSMSHCVLEPLGREL